MLCSFTVDAKNEDGPHPRIRSEWEDYLSSHTTEWVKLRGKIPIPRNVGGSRKNKWSPDEDQLLEDSVRRFGVYNWQKIALRIPGRTSKQCRERWMGHVAPGIRSHDWTSEEDVILVAKQAECGNQWAKLREFLPGRSNVAIKNRWSWLCRRDVPNHTGEFIDIVKQHKVVPQVIPALSELTEIRFESWDDEQIFDQF
jgi:hypothetical protein